MDNFLYDFDYLTKKIIAAIWTSSLVVLAGKKETEEEEVTLRRKHRRQSSVGISILSEGRESQRRRSSYTSNSWIRDADDEADELSTRIGRSRPTSWGPIGEIFYRDSLSFCDSERSPMSHHECNFQKKEEEKRDVALNEF